MIRAAEQSAPLLAVRELTISAGDAAQRALVHAISFDVGRERVGLVGESGSGKSLTARAVLGLLPRPLTMRAVRFEFQQRDLSRLAPRDWQDLRGRDIALLPQDPRQALNPVLTVKRQVEEMLQLHTGLRAADRRERVREMLGRVDLPRTVGEQYPHQLSGGMAQRVLLAMMLINRPRLLIADEPTSALDADRRTQALDLMTELAGGQNGGFLLISHDLRQVARHCERVLVMYRGSIVDGGTVEQIARSTHPYTRTLWSCTPSGRTHGTPLPVFVPDPIDPGA